MLLDGIVLFVVVVWTGLGWRAGASLQAFRLGAAVAAFFGAAPASGVTRRIVFGEEAVSTPLVEAASLCVAGVGIYVVCRLVGAVLVRGLRAAGGALSWLDRLGGAGLGLLKGGLASYFLVSVVYVGSSALGTVDPDDDLRIRESRLLEGVERYNVLVPWHLASVGTLQEALAVGLIAEEADRWSTVREYEAAADFLKREDVQRMLEDSDLTWSAYRGGYAEVLADEEVRACLGERTCRMALESAEWQKLRREIEPSERLTREAAAGRSG